MVVVVVVRVQVHPGGMVSVAPARTWKFMNAGAIVATALGKANGDVILDVSFYVCVNMIFYLLFFLFCLVMIVIFIEYAFVCFIVRRFTYTCFSLDKQVQRLLFIA